VTRFRIARGGWLPGGALACGLALGGCEAILDTGSLSEAPPDGGSGLDSSDGPSDYDTATDAGEPACVIAGITRASGSQDPANGCLSCQPHVHPTAWSNVADGTSCATDSVCRAGSCIPGCFIGASVYGSGTANPSDSCQSCQPATSTKAWTTSLADGTSCAMGTCCAGNCVDEQTDVNNCGACGVSCDCTGGACLTILASGQSGYHNSAMAVDSTSVYWIDPVVDVIARVALGGGAVTTLVAGTGLTDIAVDATSVYWTTNGLGPVGAVVKMPLGGGAPTTLASGVSGIAVAIDATSIYWIDSSGDIAKVALDGGATMTLASGQIGEAAIAVDATSVYWTITGSGTDGTIVKVPLGGGAVTTLASAQLSPTSIAVDATSVYWTNSSSVGAIMKVPLSGGTPTTLAAQAFPGQLRVDGTGVYWTGILTVMKGPLGGGTVVTLATAQDAPAALALDATSAYWRCAGGLGDIMKLTPK